MKQKTIIAIYGTANVGKSMTLARLGKQLQNNGANTAANITGNDYNAVFSYHNKIVGVQTFGDAEKFVREGLEYFLTQNCDIIAIASKSYGATTILLNNFSRENGYRLIWASPYQVNDNSITVDAIKDYTANHLCFMINDIIAGNL